MLKSMVKGLVIFSLLAILLSGSSFATKVYAASTKPTVLISCASLQAEIVQDQRIASNVSSQLSAFQGKTAAVNIAEQNLLQQLQIVIRSLQNQFNRAGC